MESQILSATNLREPEAKHPGKPAAQHSNLKNNVNIASESKTDNVTPYYCYVNNDSGILYDAAEQNSVKTTKTAHPAHYPRAGKPGLLKCLFSYRSLMVLLMHGSFVVISIQRDCMSMAVVCMFDEESSSRNSSPSSSLSWNSSATINLSSADEAYGMERNAPDWDSNMRGLIISAATFPSFLSPVLSQSLSRHIGGKWTMSVFLGTGCLLLFLSPVVARTDPYLMIAVRFVIGLAYGGNVPILADFTGWWAPSSEKLTMNAVIYTGFNTAGVFLFFTSGYVCQIAVDGGWPFVFYTNGFLSFIWLVLWAIFSSRRPEEHRFISEEEKEYIVEKRAGQRQESSHERKTPYLRILRSAPVIALLFCCSGHLWTLTLFLSFAPVYLNEAIHFSVEETGVIMSVVSGLRFLGAIAFTFLGNWLVKKTTVTKSRKTIVILGYGLGSILFFALSVVQDYSPFAVVVLMIFIFSLKMGGTVTLSVNPLDLAPQYASFISTAWFSASALTAISAPLLTTFLTSEGTLDGWRNVWYIAGSLQAAMVLCFLVFGDAKLQPWAQEPTSTTPARSISSAGNMDPNINPNTVSDSYNTSISDYINYNGNNSFEGGIDNPRFEMESYPGVTSINPNEEPKARHSTTQKIQNATSTVGIHFHANSDGPYNFSPYEISKSSSVISNTRL